MPKLNKVRVQNDGHLSALRDFEHEGTFMDAELKTLLIRIGKRRTSFYFLAENQLRGDRIVTSRLLGHFPDTSLMQARIEARKISGELAKGHIAPGKRAAVKFDAALDEYLRHLEALAAKRGKPPRWARNVARLGRQLLRPKWGKWSLFEMSNSPTAVRDWHADVSKSSGPVNANRAAQVIRAAYKHAKRLNRALPPDLPTSGIAYNEEAAREVGLRFQDFPKWRTAWEAIESPVRRAYYLTALLTGPRPGELGRVKWTDVRPRQRVMVIGKSKSGLDIMIPLSIPIVRALKMARDAKDGDRTRPEFGAGLVFPGCEQKDRGQRDGLPIYGQALRHTYKTVATDLKIEELLVELLMGHTPVGVSRKYVVRLILLEGQAMREAQRKISRRIVSLLGLA